MNRLRHAGQDVKELVIWESEIPSNQLEPEVVSINISCKSFMASNTTRNPPAGSSDSPFLLVASCNSSTMDTCGTYANKLGVALPAIANSSSRTMIRLALTTSVHIDSRENKQTGRASGMEGAEVKSELGVVDTQGDKHDVTRTAPGGELKSRSMERQAGHQSRFRPWGYI